MRKDIPWEDPDEQRPLQTICVPCEKITKAAGAKCIRLEAQVVRPSPERMEYIRVIVKNPSKMKV